MLSFFKSGSLPPKTSSSSVNRSQTKERLPSAVVLSDLPSRTVMARKLLEEKGYQCPSANVAPLARGRQCIQTAIPEMILVFLSPEVERGCDSLRSIRNLTTARILAVGPSEDSQLILHAMRCGADEYMDQATLETDLPVVLGMRKSGYHIDLPQGKILGIMSASGGCGVSTIAANLCVWSAVQHGESLLLDHHLTNGDLGSILDLKPSFTLGSLGEQQQLLDRSLLERSLAKHESGARLLASPRSYSVDEERALTVAYHSMETGRSIFHDLIVDLPCCFDENRLKILRLCDRILLVLRLDFASLKNTHQALQQLSHVGIPPDHVTLVINRCGQAKELCSEKAQEALGKGILYRIPDDPKATNRAINQGAPVILDSPSSRVAKAITHMAQALANPE